MPTNGAGVLSTILVIAVAIFIGMTCYRSCAIRPAHAATPIGEACSRDPNALVACPLPR